MTKTITAARLAAFPVLAICIGACVGETGTDSEETGISHEDLVAIGTSNVHLMPLQVQSSAPTEASIINKAAHLTYYGGPVLQNVKVYAVYWNSSVPSQSTINSFYSTITNSVYMDWLKEYNTSSPAQSIGRGSLGGSFVDNKTTANVTDAAVQTELNRLFTAGSLPAPSANNYYAVHFPSGMTITASDGSQSCVQFCAYHGTYVRNGVNVYYGIMPDLSGGCASGCGGNTKINNTTSVASHELIEATTDAAVGIATVYGPPLAWYDSVNGEIGDICNAQQATVSGYTVQKQWSNARSACVSQ